MIKVSVIIVNYKAEKFIDKCIDSVKKSSFRDFELIVIDNNKINLGSCEARNLGARKAWGKYLIFLDCDTEINKNCISEYIKAFEKDRTIGAIHGKLLKLDDKKTFDSSGELFDSFGFLVDRGKDDSEAPIASGKAASYAIRADLFRKVGGYDKDFFFFVEEPDLDMRVWHLGFKVIFLPSAICYHAYGTLLKDSKNYYSKYLVRYYGTRNYILMLLKNFSGVRLLKMLTLQVSALFSLALLFIIMGKFKDGYYMLKGIFWNLFNLKIILKKRSEVQRMRKISDKELDFLFIKRPVGHYIKKVKSYLGSL